MSTGLNIQGFAWPFKFGSTGHANRSKGIKRLKQNLEAIALSEIGERYREKHIGTISYRMIFRNPNSTKLGLITALTQDAIIEQEPRVRLTKKITYKTRSTKSGTSLILLIPFEIRDTGDDDIAEAQLGER